MRILIAEDDFTSRNMLVAVLKKAGHEVVETRDGSEAWDEMQKTDAPRLAILDWMMPGLPGDEICRRLRENEKDKEHYIYLILLTARGEKEDIVAGMEAGADDYIVKPFDRHELRVRVRAGQRIIELQSELLAAKQELEVQSRTDPLTGIPNRRAILSQLEIEMSRAKREKKRVALSLLDIDHFKKVNDTYGHIVGDAVLREFAKRISFVVRTYDSLGRFGGEEFLIVIPDAEDSALPIIGERIRSIIRETDVNVEGTYIHVTVSQGMVVWDGQANVDDFIDRADKELYRAKKNGRDRIEFAQACGPSDEVVP